MPVCVAAVVATTSPAINYSTLPKFPFLLQVLPAIARQTQLCAFHARRLVLLKIGIKHTEPGHRYAIDSGDPGSQKSATFSEAELFSLSLSSLSR